VSAQHQTSGCLVSIVLPAYNEEGNIRRVYEGIRASFQGPEELEIIFVDDGSSDGTAECVRQLRLEDSAVRLVRFGRNFGHQAALFAGLQAARGVAVITLDSDLQHPPEFLPRMLDAWRGGARVVQMVRVQNRRCGLVQAAFVQSVLLVPQPAQRGLRWSGVRPTTSSSTVKWSKPCSSSGIVSLFCVGC